MSEQFPNDDLQALWDRQPVDLTTPNMKELTMSLQQSYRKEQRNLLLLNLQELTPAFGLFLWFGWQGLQASTRAWAFFGASLMSLFVGLFLLGSSLRQRRREKAFDDSTVKGELERSHSQAQHRAWLYRNVAWWYLLPCAVGIVLLLFGNGVDLTSATALIFLAVTAGFTAVLYRVNRNLGRKRYEPNVERLAGLLADLG